MRLLIALLMFISWACASGQKENKNETTKSSDAHYARMEQQLKGKWINKAFDVEVNTYNNSDTSFTVEINEYNWDIKMEVQPFITQLNDDGTYSGIQKDTEGNIIANPKGMWTLDGDTLILEDNKNKTYKYKVLIEEETAIFKSLIDYDNDGKRDDLYKGIQKKIPSE